MKHDLSVNQLISFLKTQNIELSDTQVEQLNQYYEQLLLWNKKINLISNNDIPFIISKHFLPSFLYVYYLLNDGYSNKQKLIDIGSGGGFPGIIFSIYFSDRNIVLIDSIRKKTLFLKATVKKLNLNTNVLLGRIENIEEKYDIITARAVASLDTLDVYGTRLLYDGGRMYTIKGGDFKNEITKNANLIMENREIPIVWKTFSDNLISRKMIIQKKKENN